VEIKNDSATHHALHITNAKQKAVRIQSVAGIAVDIEAESTVVKLYSVGLLTPALYIKANPTGNASAAQYEGGSNGSGIYYKGGSSGPGMTCEGGNVTSGIYAFCPSFGHGVHFKGAGPVDGPFHGMKLEGSGIGAGLRTETPGGNAIDASAPLGNGINVAAPQGTGLNISARNAGISTIATNGAGFYVLGAAHGLECYGDDGEGSGSGAVFGPLAGVLSGAGIEINAMGIRGGIEVAAEGDGASIISDNGRAIAAYGGIDGIRAVGGTGSGMSLLKGTGGHDLTFETPDCTVPVTTDVTNPVLADMIKINGVVSPAELLAISANTMATGTVDDSVFAPTATEFEAADITDADAEFYRTRTLIVTSGTIERQARAITGYALIGGKGHFTVKELSQPLADGDTFIIV